ncbi:MAG: M20 family metallopeptidase [Clostridiales bacterium]|nr:M20 family metallopeptidase [Clostridiales bacterium]
MIDFPTAEALLATLVAYPTVNGQERPLAEEIARLAAGLGMRTEVQPVAEGRANVYAEIGEGPCLLLCGHLDVVPAEGAWHSDPFTLTERGDSYVARGSADMKGAIAAMLRAAADRVATGLNGIRLGLLFVADEESGNTGIKRFFATHPGCADACVIGEPTELEVAVAHRGVARFWIELHGRAAHSSLPALGNNALVSAAKAILALEAENARLAAFTHPILPPRTLCVTVAQGGERENIVPDAARLLVDYRLFPEDSPAAAEQTVRDVLDRLAREDARFAYSLRPHCYLPGGALPGEHPWVRAVCRIVADAVGKPRAPVEFRAGCEQALALNAGVPTVVVGPGSLSEAHTVDEALPKAELAQAVCVYGRLIDRFLTEYGANMIR